MNTTIIENTQDDRKSRILKAATTLFSQYGYNGVSIRQISKETNCNLAAISYYFGGKDNLYLECLNNLEPDVLKEFEGILGPALDRADVDQKLLRFCEAFYSFVSAHSEALRILINELTHGSRKLELENNFLWPILDRLEAFLNDGISRGIISEQVEPKLVTRTFFSIVVQQVLYSHFRAFEDISPSELSRKLVKNFTGEFYV